MEVMLVTSSAKVERDALLEKSEARHSVEDIKQAEEMARQAIAKKERMEKAWHQREEERARYTDEQRAWWDEMAREAKQDANPTADRDKSAQKHGKLIDKQQRAFSEIEGAVRHNNEEFAAGKESEAKSRREQLEKERTSILVTAAALSLCSEVPPAPLAAKSPLPRSQQLTEGSGASTLVSTAEPQGCGGGSAEEVR